MKNKILMLFIVGIFLFSMTSVMALECAGTGKQNQNYSIPQVCGDSTYVTLLTIQYPNKSIEAINTNMTSSGGGAFYYIFSNTSQLGRYDYCGISDGCDNTFCSCFEITNSGQKSGTSDALIAIIGIGFFLILSILLFLAFMKHETKFQLKATYLLGSYLFFISSVNIISIVIRDTLISEKLINFFDSFTAIAFLLFWFAFGLVAIMWGLSFFQTLMFKHSKKNMEKYG